MLIKSLNGVFASILLVASFSAHGGASLSRPAADGEAARPAHRPTSFLRQPQAFSPSTNHYQTLHTDPFLRSLSLMGNVHETYCPVGGVDPDVKMYFRGSNLVALSQGDWKKILYDPELPETHHYTGSEAQVSDGLRDCLRNYLAMLYVCDPKHVMSYKIRVPETNHHSYTFFMVNSELAGLLTNLVHDNQGAILWGRVILLDEAFQSRVLLFDQDQLYVVPSEAARGIEHLPEAHSSIRQGGPSELRGVRLSPGRGGGQIGQVSPLRLTVFLASIRFYDHVTWVEVADRIRAFLSAHERRS